MSILTPPIALDAREVYRFRPWVRRAGLSIVVVAAAITAVLIVALTARPEWRFGWFREPFVWVYVGTLWAGGAKVWLGTLRPIAEVFDDTIVLRPLHQLFRKVVRWDAIRGTEQTGDRLIVYYDTPRGMRFVALNLNLVKGRREFLKMLDARLAALGFVERVVEKGRYLTKSETRDSRFEIR